MIQDALDIETINDAEPAARDSELEAIIKRIAKHQTAGRLSEALGLADSAITEHGAHPLLLHFRGQVLFQSGQIDEGISQIEQGLKEAPENPIQLCDYGAILAQIGRLDDARTQFEIALEIAPNYPAAHGNLGGLMVMKQEFSLGIEHLRKAAQLDPQMLDARKNLGNAYLQVNQPADAVGALYEALAIDPHNIGVHILLSNALFRRNRFEAAEHHARRALELEPSADEAYLHLGNALASMGRMDEAADAYTSVTGLSPTGIPALSKLIHLRKTTTDAPELEMVKSCLDQLDSIPEEGKVTLLFAAGKAHDDLKAYNRAFGFFAQANDIQAKIHPFDLETVKQRDARIKEFCTPKLIQRHRSHGADDVAPVFICGMPRSGTTLTEQMMSKHPNCQAGGEMMAVMQAFRASKRLVAALEEREPEDNLSPDDFTQFGEEYISYIRREGIRSEHFTDKMPGNYRYIGILALALPRAKFLIMRRHPLDCLLSNYMQHFGRNQPFSTDFKNLGAVYRQFDLMAQHWSALLPDQVRQVRYEDIISDAEGQMRAVLDFVGLDWDPAVLDHKGSLSQVNTASLAQIREPVYSTSIARWRNYGPLLKDLASEIRDFLTLEELEACGAKPAC